MVNFIKRMFGGGKQSSPKPTPKPVASAKTGAADSAKAKAGMARKGRARNQTRFTDPLGITPAQKSGLTGKYLTGA